MPQGGWWTVTAVVMVVTTAVTSESQGQQHRLRGFNFTCTVYRETCTTEDEDEHTATGAGGGGGSICCGYRVSECVSNIGMFLGVEWSCRRAQSPEKAVAVTKRVKEDSELAAVPWQTLWLLQSSRQECDYQEAVLGPSLDRSDWLMMPNRLEDAIGHCPVRFRSHVDPHRWLPRNLVVSECLCEGTPCAKNGLHVCVTAFATRTVFSLYTGKKRILLAVGCICAIQKTRLAQVITPQTVD